MRFPSIATRRTVRTIREYAFRFWRILVQADRVLKIFRSRFRGKCSPVHFFWGGRRPGGHALFRSARSRTSGRHSQSAGLGRARSVLTRSQQLWILGRWRPDRLSRLLLVRLSGAAGVRGRARAAGRSVLQPGTSESSCCPTIASGSPTLPTTRCWSSCSRRTRRRPRWRTGIGRRSSDRSIRASRNRSCESGIREREASKIRFLIP